MLPPWVSEPSPHWPARCALHAQFKASTVIAAYAFYRPGECRRCRRCRRPGRAHPFIVRVLTRVDDAIEGTGPHDTRRVAADEAKEKVNSG